MAQIHYKDKPYSSLHELPIPRIKETVALHTLAQQSQPKRPEIVKSIYGPLTFISYRQGNLPPSPETHLMAQRAAEAAIVLKRDDRPLRIVDIGTGSGLIAITMAHQLRESGLRRIIIATDISGRALETATLNAEANNAQDIVFRRRDMLQGIRTEFGAIDMIVCNPPFSHANRIPNKVREAGFIPELSVSGGNDSLDYYRRLFSEASVSLSDRGIVIAQIQEYKASKILAIARANMRGVAAITLKGLRGRVTTLIAGNPSSVDSVGSLFVKNAQPVGSVSFS